MARILYFAQLAEQLGTTAEEVSLPAEITTVAALLAWLRDRGPPWQKALADGAVQVTVNRQFGTPDTPLDDRAEIALFVARA